jgi:asparagine synthase (glutamine-hydrolysing)
MCGIAGIVDLQGRPIDASILGAISGVLGHRGPDGEGAVCDNSVGLAHCRLAIIDPDSGAQPMSNDDGSVVLTYNGEVYNYVEIREELKKHYQFRTQSDTEVVLRAYEKWGIDCLKRFRGMFAFALYDKRSRKVYLVRDRLGIKPLYYYHGAERIVFCSELSALLKAGVPREINPEALAGYLRWQYVPTPLTIYRDVHKLQPGHYLEVNVDTGAISKHCYWSLEVDIRERSEQDCLEELNAVLDETMRMYVRSDVPFGAFLSGGVDSSLVTALMARHLPDPVRTFSIGFYEREHSELPYAAEVSSTLATNHFEKVVSPDLAREVLQKLAVHFGEPFADSSAVPTYYVAREAASQVKMVLSGDGGDELFGGYWSYEQTFRDMTQPRGRLARAALALTTMIGPTRKLRRAAASRIASALDKHRAQRDIFAVEEVSALLRLEVKADDFPEMYPEASDDKTDLLGCFQAQDARTYMMDDVLTKVDRMSMANSLEVRVPLLDHKIVELAFSLPLSMRLRWAPDGKRVITKHLLKKSTARFFPEAFLERPKSGFGIPLAAWCRDALRPLIDITLRDSRSPIFEWLDFSATQRLLDSFYHANRSYHAARIWSLLMLDMWFREVHLN